MSSERSPRVYRTYDGTIMNSWNAKRPPAWELPLISQSHFILTENLPSVEDVHEWNWEDVWLLGTGKVGDVSIKGNTLERSV